MLCRGKMEHDVESVEQVTYVGVGDRGQNDLGPFGLDELLICRFRWGIFLAKHRDLMAGGRTFECQPRADEASPSGN